MTLTVRVVIGADLWVLYVPPRISATLAENRPHGERHRQRDYEKHVNNAICGGWGGGGKSSHI